MSRAKSSAAGSGQAVKDILTQLCVHVFCPDETCPSCDKRQGEKWSIVHLKPTRADPSNVFVHFLLCLRCTRHLKNLKGKALKAENQRIADIMDAWLLVEFGPKKRGEA